jgi:NAD(P)-dependent dehydrogenase (short-subunit alcohol dehydrogenase family)
MLEQSDRPLTGRVAVVTGASRGVGRAIAEALAGQGASVALVARGAGPLAELERELVAGGGRAIAVAADLAEAGAATAVAAEVSERLGPATILVNAAGTFGPINLVRDVDPRAWVDTLTINAVAPFRTIHAFLPGMLEQGCGRIVNVTSAAALHPPGALNSAYGTSKVALNQLTRHLAAELAGTGVTANVFHPGDVKAEIWADIRDQVAALGEVAEGFARWARRAALVSPAAAAETDG